MATGDKQEADVRQASGTEIDLVPSGSGFILKIGPISLWLDRPAAEEVMCLLADVLEPGDPIAVLSSAGSN